MKLTTRELALLSGILIVLVLGLVILRPSQVTSSAERPLVRLRYATFDPLLAEPVPPLARRLTVRDGRPALYLVQFTGPVREEWKTAVREVGVHLYGYIPDYTFIARMDAAVAERVRSLPFVRWVGPYHPAYRLAPELQEVKRSEALEGAEAITVTVQTLPDVDLDALGREIEGLGSQILGQASGDLAGYFRVLIAADRLDELASLEGVLWVEPYFEPELCNDVGGGQIMRAGEIRSSLGLYGSGQIVGVADTGLDTGDQNTLHPDVAGRLIKTYCLGRPNPCDWSDYVAHGTHVVGSVLGNGTRSGSNPAAHQYANTYAGVAPEAQLVFQSIADSYGRLGGIPDDEGDLMRQAYQDGARIHTNSWGGPTGGTTQNPEYGGYIISSQQVDRAMWEHKDLLILFAAGNEGADTDGNGVIDPDSIGQPGTAKNVLTVGASENDRATIATTWGDSYGSPINTDRRADNSAGMAAFSSRGPTDDGRVKPDIVAPGTYVASMRTRQYIFDDDLEDDTSGYSFATINGGTGNTWQLLTDDPHSPTHYWKDVVNGTYTANAMTVLLTPAMNVWPAGSFDVQFWHKYNLGSQDHLVILFADADGTVIWLTLNLSGSQSTYTPFSVSLNTAVLLNYDVDPSTLRVGFAILSEDDDYNSTWWLDDIRVDGADWGTLGSVGLTQHGDTVDESYVMMGGTSMATPLTAGAAALVREWLTRIKGVSNPSAALMKAVLLNGAADMAPGQYGSGSTQEIPAQRPNNVTGWGRVDLVESLNPPSPRQIWFKDNTTGLSTGGTAVYTLTIGSSQSQSAVMLSPPPLVTPSPPLPITPSPSHLTIPSPAEAALFAGPRLLHPLGTDQLLQNPGFETGTWSPWQTYGSPDLTNIIKHSGTWSAHMGNYNNADDEIWQEVDIPADATDVTIDFWYRLRTDETYTGYDYFCYGIWDQTGTTAYVLRCVDFGQTGDRDWTEETYSLDTTELISVTGQTVLLGFYVTTDSSLTSRAWVDDTALYVTTGGPTETPTPTPTNTPGPTPTPTPTPATCPETITDGGFEQAIGDFSHPNWNVADNARFTVNQSIAHTGQNGAILGWTSSPATGDLWQAVSVPADASSATLSFWYETLGDGSFTVDVDITDSGGSNVLVHLTTLTTAGYTWQQFTHDFTAAELSAIAGQDVRLRFRISNVSDPEDVVIDDVSWQICSGGGPTPTPTPTTTPPPTGGTFRITLAWTDYPGEPAAAKALVNDLDLEVIGPNGTHYYGNQGLYTSGQCLRSGQWDACNNVEGVIIPDAPYGTYTVIVHGVNVPQGPQPFALVASGDYLQEGNTPPPAYSHFAYLPLVLR